MDEISQGPKWDFRLPPARWLIAAAVAGLIAVITTLALTGARHGVVPASTGTPHSPHPRLSLPVLGAAGFPTPVYPLPSHHQAPLIMMSGACPSSSGLEAPSKGTSHAAMTVINQLGQSFRSDLRLTDRVLWPQILLAWETAALPSSRGPSSVLYSGPLDSYHQPFAPPDIAHAIQMDCGSKTARDTWMIFIGSRPGLQGEFLLLTRRGHVLLWNGLY